jgi:hypothetical protein
MADITELRWPLAVYIVVIVFVQHVANNQKTANSNSTRINGRQLAIRAAGSLLPETKRWAIDLATQQDPVALL